jgi:hypothetical protein
LIYACCEVSNLKTLATREETHCNTLLRDASGIERRTGIVTAPARRLVRHASQRLNVVTFRVF